MKFILEGDQEKRVKLKLHTYKHKVQLRGTDEEGREWLIMDFYDGKFIRKTGVREKSGIEVDDYGMIKEGEASMGQKRRDIRSAERGKIREEIQEMIDNEDEEGRYIKALIRIKNEI